MTAIATMMRNLPLWLMFTTLLGGTLLEGSLQRDDEPVALASIYRDWDSAANDAAIQVDSTFPSDSEWRETVRYEMNVMSQSAVYAEMESSVSRLAPHVRYIIRISERYPSELHTFPDSVVLKGNKLMPTYDRKPEAGIITWIIGTNDGATHIIYRKRVGKGKIVHEVVKGCKLSVAQIGSNSYNFFGNLAYQNVISIWTPSVKKHVYVNGLRAISDSKSNSTGVVAPPDLQQIARLVTKYSSN